MPPTPENVLGVLSLVFWALIRRRVKYLALVMRADNHGEGGILALLALVRRAATSQAAAPCARDARLFGAALLYGDGIITPAISVLAPSRAWRSHAAFEPYVVPITVRRSSSCCSSMQKRGTGRVGNLRARDGRVVLLPRRRSASRHIVAAPGRARRAQPDYASRSSRETACVGFFVLGVVVLVHHRRRSALRRHGPLRPPPDPPRLVPSSCRRCS